jgi:hypothetical protein
LISVFYFLGAKEEPNRAFQGTSGFGDIVFNLSGVRIYFFADLKKESELSCPRILYRNRAPLAHTCNPSHLEG